MGVGLLQQYVSLSCTMSTMFTSIQSHFESGTLVLELIYPVTVHGSSAAEVSAPVYAVGIEAMNGAESNTDIHSVLITVKPTTPIRSISDINTNTAINQADWEALSVQQQAQLDGFASWADTINCYPKPVVAALHGCVDQDFMALSLMCDGIVAESTTVFSITADATARRSSIKGGFVWALLQALPRSIVFEYLSSPSSITASRLHQLGIVNRLTASDQSVSTALQWCKTFGQCDPSYIAALKDTCNEVKNMTFAQSIQHEKNQRLRWITKPTVF